MLTEPPGGFTRAQIGRPVIVTQAPSRDDREEHDQILCVGEVVSERILRLRWISASLTPTRGSVRFNFIIQS